MTSNGNTIVSNVQTSSVMKDNTITTTTTITSAVFSNQKGHEGEFLDAGQKTITTVENLGKGAGPDTYIDSGYKSIGYRQAALTIGADNLAKGVSAATPGLGTAFAHATAQDARQHPGKYIAAGLGVASGGSSLAGAPLAAAILRAGAGAAALWEAVTHWH